MRLPFTGRAPAPTDLPASETKSAPLVALELSRRARFTSTDYTSLCREGYGTNPVVYRCVRLIAEAAASVPMIGAPDVLLSDDTMEQFFGYLQLAGRAYLLASVLDGDIVAIRALRPDSVRPLTDRAGRPAGFEIRTASGKSVHPRDPLTGRCDVFGIELFDPMNTGGQSPLRAAATSVDLHNQGTRWAKSLLDNSARPSGALVYNGGPGDRLTADQVSRLKTELESGFTGPDRAGRPMVLEGGLDWKSMGMSPADMDFTQGRREAARDISLAFGVPPMLLGIPGDNTYANYQEANRAFWRQTILPLIRRSARGLSRWLSAFGEEVALRADLDAVPALASERAALWARLQQASFLTDVERRALAGLEPVQ